MDKVGQVIKAANTFYDELQKDRNARFRSWEHCYKSFHDARHNTVVDYDYLSLQLAFYLASWGMYRGSSFLLQKDYKVHEPVVKELLQEQYDCLLGIKCSDLRKNDIQIELEHLENYMKDYYSKIRKSVKSDGVKKGLSSILITKILMGTLGCVPAYDRFFIEGVRELKITTGIYTKTSLLKLVDFYEGKRNHDKLEELRNRLMVRDDLKYPQMKLLDMAFWEIGFAKARITLNEQRMKIRGMHNG